MVILVKKDDTTPMNKTKKRGKNATVDGKMEDFSLYFKIKEKPMTIGWRQNLVEGKRIKKVITEVIKRRNNPILSLAIYNDSSN